MDEEQAYSTEHLKMTNNHKHAHMFTQSLSFSIKINPEW